MSRKVLDSNMGDSDVEWVMNNIVSRNPQLNSRIEEVHNESSIFLCQVLRIYPFDDKAYVKILNNNKKIYCRLSHEILCNGMSIDYLPNGVEKTVNGKNCIVPYDNLYGIVIKVRWLNLDDENVLIGYVNIHDNFDLKSSSDTGELSLKSGKSIISIDDERINIMTPHLFINGLPYDEPKLKNYYDKTESNMITNTIQKSVDMSDYYTKTEIDEMFRALENNNTSE